jgi:hypothetical protein
MSDAQIDEAQELLRRRIGELEGEAAGYLAKASEANRVAAELRDLIATLSRRSRPKRVRLVDAAACPADATPPIADPEAAAQAAPITFNGIGEAG